MNQVFDIAAVLGINFKDRIANDPPYWLYDGRAIALKARNSQGIVHSLVEGNLLHEIGHWLACSGPAQRTIPEFACFSVLRESPPYAYKEISREEQLIQEVLAIKISSFFGKALDIPLRFVNREGKEYITGDWKDYDLKVEEELLNPLWKKAEEGSHRFQKMIPELQAIVEKVIQHAHR